MEKKLTPTERIEHWAKKAEGTPESAATHFNLGLAYTDVSKMTSAEKAYRRAVEIKPDLVQAWVNLAGVLLLQWRFDESIEAGQKAVELDGELPLVHFNLGQAYLYQGDSEALVRCNRRVLELEPDHPAGNYFLAVGLLAQNNGKEARFYMDRAARLGYRPTPEFLKAMERVETDGLHVFEVGE
ncbi:MAG: hypothetical protein DRJ65_17850 [Acidobacteria bacterium]|nr:MAG: hypothetical protein DRJ65_17850 [Acidobacteriota bacterium]